MPYLPPFQQWFIELVQLIGNIVIAISGILVARAAHQGVEQWRREAIGKRKIEAAHQIAKLALQFQAEFSSARKWYATPDEWADRVPQGNESEAVAHVLNEQYARWRRLKPLEEILVKLQLATWDARALSLNEMPEIYVRLRRLLTRFGIEVQEYFTMKYQEAKHTDRYDTYDPFKDADERQKMVYGIGEDGYAKEIDLLVLEVETALKPINK